MASIPSERFYNNNWLKINQNHCLVINSIIIRDSIVAGVTRYTDIWSSLCDKRLINLGISGDRVENVPWCARDIPFLSSLEMSLFSVVQIILTKIPLMISLKV